MEYPVPKIEFTDLLRDPDFIALRAEIAVGNVETLQRIPMRKRRMLALALARYEIGQANLQANLAIALRDGVIPS